VFEEMAAETRRLAVPLSYDTVVHEHDLRHAIKRPGARDASGVMSSMEVAVWLMTNDLDRRGFGRVSFRAGGRTWECGSGDLRLELDLDSVALGVPPVWELLRLSGSRRSFSQAARLPWKGDFPRCASPHGPSRHRHRRVTQRCRSGSACRTRRRIV
jgi:hypothetical protein